MKRRIIYLLLSILLLQAPAYAGAQETVDGFQYQVEKAGTVTVTAYRGGSTDVDVPAVIEGKPVTEIGSKAFAYTDTVLRVTIPEGVLKIGAESFLLCENLQSVLLPGTLRELGKYAFLGCRSLGSVVIPEGVEEVPESCFDECAGLTAVAFPASLKTIGVSAFRGAGMLVLDLPYGLQKIGEAAFMGVAHKDLVLPDSIREIGRFAFSFNENLESVVLPSGLKKIEENSFDNNKELESVAIPKSVTSISGSAFMNSDPFTVWGLKGSYAETYAKNKRLQFVAVDPVKRVDLTHNGAEIPQGKITIDLSGETRSLRLSAQTDTPGLWHGVIWKSSNGKVASVSANGLVTGLKKGKATVTAAAADGGGAKASCEITVVNLVHEILITGENIIQAGKKTALKAKVLPETADNKGITWSSSDKDTATIDAKGIVTAKKVTKQENVTITATSKDGSGVFAEFILTVLP